METTIVKLDPQQYGLSETKAREIEALFTPMLEKMTQLEGEYNKVITLPISKETCKAARDLRLKYVKIRTATSDIHKELKDFYLKGGRFVDGWRNAQLFASQGIEEKLKAIEEYYEKQEQERKAKLQAYRAGALAEYGVEVIPLTLGEMTDEVWTNYLFGTRENYRIRKEAECKAEKERLARERAEQAERERLRLEHEQLRKDLEEKERAREIERAAQQEKERKEREAYEAQLLKERLEKEAAEAALEAQRKAQEEEKARARKEEAERKKAEKRAHLAPDTDKLRFLAQSLQFFTFPSVKSQEAQFVVDSVRKELSEISDYILARIELM